MNSTYRQNNHHQRQHWYTEELHQDFFFIQLFTPVLQNTSETFYQISEACNPGKGFLCQKKKWHLVTDGGSGIVNLIRRDWRKKTNNNTTSQITALSFLSSWWVTVLKTRGDWVGGGASVFSGNGTGDLARELHYAVEGTNTSSRRLFLRLQDTLLPFLGAPWMNFTHTLSCLNCTRNLSHTQTWLNVIQVDGESRSFNWDFTLHPLLLVWDVYVELFPVCSRGPGAVDFGDNLNQMFAAE